MVPPVPIPNTVVKHSEAESTWVATPWEDRKLPVKKRSICCMAGAFLYMCISSQREERSTSASQFRLTGSFPWTFSHAACYPIACAPGQASIGNCRLRKKASAVWQVLFCICAYPPSGRSGQRQPVNFALQALE